MSPLLRLPGEIRNRIYKYALCGKHIAFLHPLLYMSDDTCSRTSPPIHVRSNSVPKLLRLTQICRQIHAETDLLVFKANEFRIGNELSFKTFVQSLSQRQLEAITTCVWPRRCETITDATISQLTGLKRIVVWRSGQYGDDFYGAEDNTTPRVLKYHNQQLWYAMARLDAWEIRGVHVEYCT